MAQTCDISIESMGKLSGKNPISLPMLKSLIIAATSIACIFLSGNISEARKPVARNTDGCLSQKFTQKEISLVPAEDIKGICQSILKYYKLKNERTLKFAG